jgi:hypothetical protein
MKLKFGYDTASISEYVEMQRGELLTNTLFAPKTMELLSGGIQEGIKYKELLKYMDTDVLFQDGAGCDLVASGTTTFDEKELQVYPIGLMKNFCAADLEQYWTKFGLKAGSNQGDTIPYEEAFVSYQTGLIAEEIGKMLWQSDLLTGAGNLQFFDGFNSVIDATSGVINGNSGTGWTPIAAVTGITVGNVISIFGNMVYQLPAYMQGRTDISFVCGWDTYVKLLNAYFSLNNFHFNGATVSPYESGEFILPTFGIKVYGLKELNGTNRIHLSRLSNYRIGTDLTGESEDFTVWEEKKEQKIYLRVRFKLGCQIEFGRELVTFKLT